MGEIPDEIPSRLAFQESDNEFRGLGFSSSPFVTPTLASGYTSRTTKKSNPMVYRVYAP